jgi:general secretion pathway protein E
VYEVVVPNDDILRQISSGASEQELRQCIRLAGTPDLMNDALSKVCDGITSLEEVMKMRSV